MLVIFDRSTRVDNPHWYLEDATPLARTLGLFLNQLSSDKYHSSAKGFKRILELHRNFWNKKWFWKKSYGGGDVHITISHAQISIQYDSLN